MLRQLVMLKLCLGFLSLCPLAMAQNAFEWNQWRGPTRDGYVPADAPSWPDKLDSLERLWRVEMGPSYSGPIVSPEFVYVTETADKKDEVIRALERTTGREAWRKQWAGAMKVPFFAASRGSWIRATPAYDGETVYVAGIRDVLLAFDAKTGEQRWRVDFMERYKSPEPTFGFVSSPLVIGNDLYVQAGGGFCKLDKRTGESHWRTLDDGGGMNGSAFASPVLGKLAGREQLLVQTREKLSGVEPKDGTVLWSIPVPNFRGMNILTPVVFGDGVFTSSYQNGSYFYGVKREGDSLVVTESWKSKPVGYMTSPILRDGHAYLLLQNQRLACVDLKNGEQKWRSSSFGQYQSLVAQGDRILALDERGELLLFRATPEKFELLSQTKVSEQDTWAHLAVAGDQVFIRELNAITAYRWNR